MRLESIGHKDGLPPYGKSQHLINGTNRALLHIYDNGQAVDYLWIYVWAFCVRIERVSSKVYE